MLQGKEERYKNLDANFNRSEFNNKSTIKELELDIKTLKEQILTYRIENEELNNTHNDLRLEINTLKHNFSLNLEK